MPVVVAFISQKGGVGKSTLARALAAVVAHAGNKARIGDLDLQQGTAIEWARSRRSQTAAPKIDVQSYSSAAAAVSDSAIFELLVLDAAGGTNAETLAIAKASHLVVQPTGPSVDDLRPGVLLFHELLGGGIPRKRLSFAICRSLNADEETQARQYLELAGYDVLPGALPERAAYRQAQNIGRAASETDRRELNERTDALMLGLLSRVAGEVGALRTATDARAKVQGAKKK